MTPETPTRQFYTFVIASGFFYGCIPIKSKYNIITCLGRCWSLTPGYMYSIQNTGVIDQLMDRELGLTIYTGRQRRQYIPSKCG